MKKIAQSGDFPEADLIDRIANALPAEVRADYYRELRHCRSLPENDEMLRILRAMQFLTLLMVQAPSRVAVERERLEQLFKSRHRRAPSRSRILRSISRPRKARTLAAPAAMANTRPIS